MDAKAYESALRRRVLDPVRGGHHRSAQAADRTWQGILETLGTINPTDLEGEEESAARASLANLDATHRRRFFRSVVRAVGVGHPARGARPSDQAHTPRGHRRQRLAHQDHQPEVPRPTPGGLREVAGAPVRRTAAAPDPPQGLQVVGLQPAAVDPRSVEQAQRPVQPRATDRDRDRGVPVGNLQGRAGAALPPVTRPHAPAVGHTYTGRFSGGFDFVPVYGRSGFFPGAANREPPPQRAQSQPLPPFSETVSSLRTFLKNLTQARNQLMAVPPRLRSSTQRLMIWRMYRKGITLEKRLQNLVRARRARQRIGKAHRAASGGKWIRPKKLQSHLPPRQSSMRLVPTTTKQDRATEPRPRHTLVQGWYGQRAQSRDRLPTLQLSKRKSP